MVIEVIAALAVAIWLYPASRGGFGVVRARRRRTGALAAWLGATGHLSNEADGIGECIGSLLGQIIRRMVVVRSTTTAATARRPLAAVAAINQTRLTVVPTAAPGRLDRQALGRKTGYRRGASGSKTAGLSAADRRRHRLRAGRAARPGRARRQRPAGADLTHGQAALRELCRALPDPGLHLFLPDAVSVSLGQQTGRRHGGGRREECAVARGLAAGGQHRSHPRRIDRRLRLAHQGARTSGSG